MARARQDRIRRRTCIGSVTRSRSAKRAPVPRGSRDDTREISLVIKTWASLLQRLVFSTHRGRLQRLAEKLTRTGDTSYNQMRKGPTWAHIRLHRAVRLRAT